MHDFYLTAAQVIPVLFLAMVVETKLLDQPPSSYDPSNPDDPSHWNVTQAIGRWFVTAVLVLGELAALSLIYQNKDGGPVDHAIIWGALFLGTIGIAWPIFGRQWSYFRQWWNTPARGDWGFALFFMVVLAMASAVWISLFA